MKKELKVLNHGLVRLINHMGSDLSIVRNARVSYDASARAGEDEGSDKRLINYLYNNGHNTPFEAVTFTFEIKAPIFVFRQWHRHRCVSGDTVIHFDQKRRNHRKSLHKDTIENLYNKFHLPKNSTGFPVEGMLLRCLNEDTLEIENTSIVSVIKSEPKDMYQIESSSGRCITTSPEHRFFSEKGWKTLEEVLSEDLKVCLSTTKRNNKHFWKPDTYIDPEIWKTIDINTDYEVSNHGNVRNKNTQFNLKPVIQKDGYIRFYMGVKNTRNKVVKYAQELVLNAFNPTCDNALEVSHKDHNRYNNHLFNLHWASHRENCNLSVNVDRHSRLIGDFESIINWVLIPNQISYDLEVAGPYHNFIADGYVIHNSQSYNELSARYKELPEEYYIPEAHLLGKQNDDNKQMRDIITAEEFEQLSVKEKVHAMTMLEEIDSSNKSSFETYHYLIEHKVPREIARSVLPFGTYSHMFATMNLHNLFGFLRERLHEHAQYEIRVYAEAILTLILPIVPVATETFIKSLVGKKGYEYLGDI